MKKQTQKKQPRRKTSTTPKPEPAAGQTPARFPEVKGKVLEWVELDLRGDEDGYIEIGFQDQTALVFEILPYVGFTVRADYGDWKTRNWRAIKRWPLFESE